MRGLLVCNTPMLTNLLTLVKITKLNKTTAFIMVSITHCVQLFSTF